MSSFEIFENIDLNSQYWIQNPSTLYAKLLKRGPYFDGTKWLVARHAHVAAVLKSQATSKRVTPDTLGGTLENSLIFQDPPDHTRLRSVVQDFFSPRAIQQEEDMVAQVVVGLIRRVKERRRMEFIGDIASQLPSQIIGNLLGVPKESNLFLYKFVHNYFYDDTTNKSESINALRMYFTNMVSKPYQVRPAGLLTRLMDAQVEGKISRAELIELCVLLFIGGSETTINLLGSGLLTLLQHPQALGLIQNNPALIPGAVEEMLRYEPPILMSSWRVTTEPLVLGDTEIPVGQPVEALLGAANRDPDKFPDPNRFDIRRNPVGHFAFGAGIHFCIGAALTRMEAKVTLATLLAELPTLQLEKKSLPCWQKVGNMGRRFLTLPINQNDYKNHQWRENTITRGLEYLNLTW
jgi:pimeloyl-[acyl-carrier protein] synthase